MSYFKRTYALKPLIYFFRASQFGYDQICQHLINAKADSRAHPVTKYSPLYIAVHQGHYAVSKLLLNAFPFLINVSALLVNNSKYLK